MGLLAPRIYEGGWPQARGEYCGTPYFLYQHFGEFELRSDSPRPPGTPLVNEGGKGCGINYNSGATVFRTKPASLTVHFSDLIVSRVTRRHFPWVFWKSRSMSATASTPYRYTAHSK